MSGPVVHVVDDDDSLRTALMRVLRAAGHATRGYASAGEFLIAVTADTAGCLLLDMRLPGPSGLELQQALAARGVNVPIVFLSGHGDIASSVRAIKAGARDFLTKPVGRAELLAAVEAALAFDADERAKRERTRALRERYERLTAREREVLAGVVAGDRNKQVAAELGVAERTVKAHRAQVMEKLGARSVAELVRMADELAVGTPPPRA